ncbi:hypothetical protein Cni_G19277 [Canna indica]|uniref:Uncharacterized protein n=1 Tax=Canna indica TaxID=4628 RepID=A0AAQ3KM62_9LILI|nr:hypothetical protein Cni_G19277 [Canna indica]
MGRKTHFRPTQPSSSSSSGDGCGGKVMLHYGTIREVDDPTSVVELMLEHPHQFVVDIRAVFVGSTKVVCRFRRTTCWSMTGPTRCSRWLQRIRLDRLKRSDHVVGDTPGFNSPRFHCQTRFQLPSRPRGWWMSMVTCVRARYRVMGSSPTPDHEAA